MNASCAPAWAAGDPRLVYGAVNTNYCPSGSSKIVTEAACFSVAPAVGRSPANRGLNQADWPSGCITARGGGDVELNHHLTGEPNPYFKPLCAGAPAFLRVCECLCVAAWLRVRVYAYVRANACVCVDVFGCA